jgi:putative tryptophan/tyrosine transport system substrate-binding protein
LTPRSRPCRKREPARFWSARNVTRLEQVVAPAARYAVPAIYSDSQFTAAGGLMTSGSNIIEGYRQAGRYAAPILKGEKPRDLPVRQSTKVELIINLKTAKALGITMPITLLGRADEE